jgi:hypothetical protein
MTAAVHLDDDAGAGEVRGPIAVTSYFEHGEYRVGGPLETVFAAVEVGGVTYYVYREAARDFANVLTRVAAELVAVLDDRTQVPDADDAAHQCDETCCTDYGEVENPLRREEATS